MYADYLAMFINYEGFKAVMEEDNVKNPSTGFGKITRVNDDFEEKRDKVLRGERVKPNSMVNKKIQEKMAEFKNTMLDAREGYIVVDVEGNETIVRERPSTEEEVKE